MQASPEPKVSRSVKEDPSAVSTEEVNPVAPLPPRVCLLRHTFWSEFELDLLKVLSIPLQQESLRVDEEIEVERPIFGPQQLPNSDADKVTYFFPYPLFGCCISNYCYFALHQPRSNSRRLFPWMFLLSYYRQQRFVLCNKLHDSWGE